MKNILLIHTGGTISMQVNAETGAVVPSDVTAKLKWTVSAK